VTRIPSGERITGSLLIGADGLWSTSASSRRRRTAAGIGHSTYPVIPTEEMPKICMERGDA
jgi:salicylate hydroxylase